MNLRIKVIFRAVVLTVLAMPSAHDCRAEPPSIDGLPIGAVARYRCFYDAGQVTIRLPNSVANGKEPIAVKRIVIAPDLVNWGAVFAGAPACVFKISDGESMIRFLGFAIPTSIAFANDGKSVAVGQSNGQTCILDITTGKLLSTIGLPDELRKTNRESPVRMVAFPSDGNALSVVCERVAGIWGLTENRILSPALEIPFSASANSSCHGKRIAVIGANGEVSVLAGVDRFERRLILGSGSNANAAAVTDDGRRVIVGCADENATLMIIDGETRTTLLRMALSPRKSNLSIPGIAAVVASPNNSRIAAALYDGRVVLVAVDERTIVGELPGLSPATSPPCVAYSKCGQYLIAGDGKGNVIVWDVALSSMAGRLPQKQFTENQLVKLWDKLATIERSFAKYSAAWTIVAAGDASLSFLQNRLTPVKDDNPAEIQGLLRDLDSDKGPRRDQASAALAARGEIAIFQIRRFLAGDLSEESRRRAEKLLEAIAPRRDAEQLRLAIAILRHIGTRQAYTILEGAEKKYPDTWLALSIAKSRLEDVK